MILDYSRQSHDGTIVVPSFHTGHLGFIPGTEVSMVLLAPQGSRGGHCEILLTPFAPNLNTLCRLSCTMVDRPGVVNRLIEAVASLRINIVKMENSAVNSLDHHVVELVLDWATSPYRLDPTPPYALQAFQHLAYGMPVAMRRYLLLYQAIMCRCGDVLVYDEGYGCALPALSVAPFADPGTWSDPERVTLARVPREDNQSRRQSRVQFEVPAHLLERIRFLTKFSRGEPLTYLMSSEATTRALRVFFPKRSVLDRIVHVAFLHLDVPGALSAITRALAQAGFNILTGLLRKKTRLESGYEVHLEYLGTSPLPAPGHTPTELLGWVVHQLRSVDATLAELAHFRVQVGLPEYPKRDEVNPIPVADQSAAREPEREQPFSMPRLSETISRASDVALEPSTVLRDRRVEFLTDVKQFMDRQPVVFLSYPRMASKHGAMLRDAIEHRFPDKFVVTDYQAPDLEVILARVIQLIRECDIFIGIWHHEGIPGQNEFGMSPWMPFEYGVAKNAGKETILVHSDLLPERVWKRIEPERARVSYTDIHFREATVPIILNYIEQHWQAKVRLGDEGGGWAFA